MRHVLARVTSVRFLVDGNLKQFRFIIVTSPRLFLRVRMKCVVKFFGLFTGGPRGMAGGGGGQQHAGMRPTRNDIIQFLHRWSWETHLIFEMRDANEGSKIRNYWRVACYDFLFFLIFCSACTVRECDSFCV